MTLVPTTVVITDDMIAQVQIGSARPYCVRFAKVSGLYSVTIAVLSTWLERVVLAYCLRREADTNLPSPC